MTVYQVMPGVMICFSDMHMEKCDSEFELQKDKKVCVSIIAERFRENIKICRHQK